MSTPPTIIAPVPMMAPAIYRYQLNRLILGKARSFAPTIMGTTKFPSTAGITGTRKKNTMTTPCMENIRLYVCGCTRAPCGDNRLSRTTMAPKPPTKNIKVIETRYRIAMRL